MKTYVLVLNKGYVLTLSQTIECLNLSRSTIYRLEKKGEFLKKDTFNIPEEGVFKKSFREVGSRFEMTITTTQIKKMKPSNKRTIESVPTQNNAEVQN